MSLEKTSQSFGAPEISEGATNPVKPLSQINTEHAETQKKVAEIQKIEKQDQDKISPEQFFELIPENESENATIAIESNSEKKNQNVEVHLETQKIGVSCPKIRTRHSKFKLLMNLLYNSTTMCESVHVFFG